MENGHPRVAVLIHLAHRRRAEAAVADAYALKIEEFYRESKSRLSFYAQD
jgi:hypothetical protein